MGTLRVLKAFTVAKEEATHNEENIYALGVAFDTHRDKETVVSSESSLAPSLEDRKENQNKRLEELIGISSSLSSSSPLSSPEPEGPLIRGCPGGLGCSSLSFPRTFGSTEESIR